MPAGKGFEPQPGKHTGEMTVREAGHKGGQKVKDLIEKGEEMERGGQKGHRAA